MRQFMPVNHHRDSTTPSQTQPTRLSLHLESHQPYQFPTHSWQISAHKSPVTYHASPAITARSPRTATRRRGRARRHPARDRRKFGWNAQFLWGRQACSFFSFRCAIKRVAKALLIKKSYARSSLEIRCPTCPVPRMPGCAPAPWPGKASCLQVR